MSKSEKIQKAVKDWNETKPQGYKEFIVYISYNLDHEIGFKLSNGCTVGNYNAKYAV